MIYIIRFIDPGQYQFYNPKLPITLVHHREDKKPSTPQLILIHPWPAGIQIHTFYINVRHLTDAVSRNNLKSWWILGQE